MKLMKKAGEVMAKRPIVPIAILFMITAASLGMIATNPPAFDMDEGGFSPDDEMSRASAIITASFGSTVSVGIMIDAEGAGGNIFTKDIFIDILRYERSLTGMNYIDRASGEERSYSELSGFRIISPVSAIAQAIALDKGYLAPDDLNNLSPHDLYGAFIAAVDSLDDDAALRKHAASALEESSLMMMQSMLTRDRIIGEESVSAKGMLMSVMILDTDLALVQGGLRGFEGDVMSETASFLEYIEEYGGLTEGLRIMVAGLVTMMSEIGQLAQQDLFMLLPIAMIVLVLLLLLIYRDLVDTLTGIFGLVIAVIWTFGISSFIGINVSTIAIAVPILILALGIDYGLHLMFRYREERRAGKSPSEAIAMTMGSVGQALTLATVTTTIAFLSYLTSSMSALADFGIMCAIGIVCAFGVMLLLVPPLQIWRDRRAEKKGKDPDACKRYKAPKNSDGDILSRISGIGGKIAAKKPLATIGVVAVMIGAFGYSATNLSYEFNLYDFVPEGTEAHDVLTYLNENYDMSIGTVNVLIYGDAWDIETLIAMELSLRNMEINPIRGLEYIDGNIHAEHLGTALMELNARLSIADFNDLYGAVFNEHGRLLLEEGPDALGTGLEEIAKFLKSPETPEMISGAAHIFLRSFVGMYAGESITMMTIYMTGEIDADNDAVLAMRDHVDAACLPFSESEIGFVTTGMTIMMATNMKEMNASQMTALFVTIVLVLLVLTIFMFYVDRGWLLGAMATIPTLVSVVMVWGTMAFIGMPLNVMTLTIASLTIGLGVTYGIHISHRYVTELVVNDLSPEEAIRKATRETGKGVFAAAITTVAGFGVMIFSNIMPMYQFGLITAMAIGFGYIGSIFVLPALLVIWGRYAKPKVVKRVNDLNAAKKDTDA